MAKTFLSSAGEFVSASPVDDHVDIARRVLRAQDITAKDYLDNYTLMFALGYARVNQEGNQFHIERKAGFSKAQKVVIEDKLLAGFEVFVNDRRFTESKERNGISLADQLASVVS
jgi:hypothetical protein